MTQKITFTRDVVEKKRDEMYTILYDTDLQWKGDMRWVAQEYPMHPDSPILGDPVHDKGTVAAIRLTEIALRREGWSTNDIVEMQGCIKDEVAEALGLASGGRF